MTYCGFPFDEIVVRLAAGIETPSDLAGKTVGIRTWTNPVKPWLFGVLEREFGLDWRACSWVSTVTDPLPGIALPPNASRSEGRSLAELLVAGDIDAAISPGPVGARDVIPLFPLPMTYAAEWFARTGILPVLHLLVLKDSTAERHPRLADAIVRGFTRAKDKYLQQLRSAAPHTDELAANDRRLMERFGIDPVPYGIDANRRSLELFIDFMSEQGYLAKRPAVDTLFAPNRIVA
jgi:4,5-dihydroxyphthalate decarboxylase